VAATDALLRAALALPILAVPARAGAVETGEVGFTVLSYRERGLIKVVEPIVWGEAQVAEHWEVRASAALDVVTGASPELVTNVSGRPVQTMTGASVDDRRSTADVRIARRIGELRLGVSRAVSDEQDYRSRAYGVEAKLDLDDRASTLALAYGRSSDRVRSADDPALDAPRNTREYLAGWTQVLSPVALVQTTLQWSRGKGWYNDPYKHTLTFHPEGGVPSFAFDTRPAGRNSLAWITRYRHHVAPRNGTLQLDYRFYRDDWDIRSHALQAAWEQSLGERWSLRPALRYYTQSKAAFYFPVIPRPQPAILSSDQRLASFGGLAPSLRATLRLDHGWKLEATVGYVHDAASLRPGGGSESFETLRAYFGCLGVSGKF
jgi:hypothetical protein